MGKLVDFASPRWFDLRDIPPPLGKLVQVWVPTRDRSQTVAVATLKLKSAYTGLPWWDVAATSEAYEFHDVIAWRELETPPSISDALAAAISQELENADPEQVLAAIEAQWGQKR